MAEVYYGGKMGGLAGVSAGNMGYPPAPSPEVCAVRSTETQNLIERNGQNLQHLSELTGRLRSLRDRLLGDRPEKDQSKPTPSGNAKILILANQAGDAEAILSTLGAIVSDLEGI